jgi:hypothetical protein
MASAPLRPKVARFRERWKKHRHRLAPKRLVFLDVEAGKAIDPGDQLPRRGWIKTSMTRTRGWSLRGTRLTAQVPHGHWKTLTFLAGPRHDRIVAPFVRDGAINGDSFPAWIAQGLVPTLAPGDIVIADNPGRHKGQPARHLILRASARLCCSCRPTLQT